MPRSLSSVLGSGRTTWSDLDEKIWGRVSAEPATVERELVRVVGPLLNRQLSSLASLRIFPEPWPVAIELSTLPLRARTANVLRKAQMYSKAGSVERLTVGELLDIPGAGVVTFLDLVCSIEGAVAVTQLASALSALKARPRVRSVALPDPRFGAPVGSGRELTIGDLTTDDVALLGPDGVREMADSIQRVAELDFASAIRDYLSAVKPKWHEDRIIALSMRLGFEEAVPATLQEIADLVGLSRERIRQLEKQLREAVLGFTRAPFLPQLDEALDLLLTSTPISEDSAQEGLSVLDSRPPHPAAVLRAAEFFGRSQRARFVELDQANVLVSGVQLPSFENGLAVLSVARRQEQRYGASNLTQLRWKLQEDGLDLEERQLEHVLRAAPSAHLGENGWFWFEVKGHQNSFVSTSRKMLAVNSPLSIGCLRDGLRRRAAHRQRDIVPPKAIMRQLYAQSPHFALEEGDECVKSVEALDAEQQLGSVQLTIVRILQGAPNGILDRDALLTQCRDAGLNMSSASVYMTYGACVEHVAPNVWTARGTHVSPATVEAFLEERGARPAPKRATGWLTDGRPWMGFELNATTLANPAIPTPKDLKTLLVNRTYKARTTEGVPCGGITTDASGAFVYGWYRFLALSGADIGDCVRGAFDLVGRTVILELGGPELLVS